MHDLSYLDASRSPVTPSTIYCIGRNYRAHATELGNPVPAEPVVFLKARSALRGLASAPVAFGDETFHHEVELCVVLGCEVYEGDDADWSAIAAVGVGLDLTRRGVQDRCKERRLPWTPAKSFRGSAIVGPLLPREAIEPDALSFTLHVEDEPRQHGEIGQMLFDVPTLLRHLASLAPLVPGDIVFTGTPEGVGPLRRGERFRLALGDGRSSWHFDGEL